MQENLGGPKSKGELADGKPLGEGCLTLPSRNRISIIFEDEKLGVIECQPNSKVCLCGGNAQRPCWHLKMAIDITQHKGFKSKWLIYSAWHKSLRLTMNSKSNDWLQLLLKLSTPANLRVYLQRIVLEETRSLRLLSILQNKKIDIEELNYEFTRTKKKWSHKSLQQDYLSNWFNSYKTTNELIKNGYVPNFKQQSFIHGYHQYQHYWFYKLTKLDDEDFWNYAKTIRSPVIDELCRVKPKSSYSRMFCEELISGVAPLEDLVDVTVESRTNLFKVPSFHSTVFDLHTSKGKTATIANLNLIRKNSHVVPDLRLSGQVLGVYWRMRASQMFQDIQDQKGELLNWTSVPLDLQMIEQALRLDSYFYPKVITSQSFKRA